MRKALNWLFSGWYWTMRRGDWCTECARPQMVLPGGEHVCAFRWFWQEHGEEEKWRDWWTNRNS